MLESSVFTFPATLHTSGGIYQLSTLEVYFGIAPEMPTARVGLAVGRSPTGFTTNSITFKRGEYATIEVSGASSSSTGLMRTAYTLFRGVIDDYGPSNLNYGSYFLQVTLRGRLSILASGTLTTSALIPKTYRDVDVPIPFLRGNQASIGYEMDPDQAHENLYPTFAESLLNIALKHDVIPDSRTEQILEGLAESPVNERAATVISAISGTLPFLTFFNVNRTDAIVDQLNNLMLTQYSYESFLDRYAQLGELMHSRLVETGEYIAFAPVLPYLPSNKLYTIKASTYSQLSWRQTSEYTNYGAAVLFSPSEANVALAGFDASAIPFGAYRRPGVLGRAIVTQLNNLFLSAFIDEDQPGKPRGYEAANDGSLAREAQYVCWTQSFANRQVIITCPYIRTDVAPMTAVKIEFPEIAEVKEGVAEQATGSVSLYGMVLGVSISVDATSARAMTSIIVGFVRSQSQQDEIDQDFLGHPFFSQAFINGRLDANQFTVEDV